MTIKDADATHASPSSIKNSTKPVEGAQEAEVGSEPEGFGLHPSTPAMSTAKAVFLIVATTSAMIINVSGRSYIQSRSNPLMCT